MCTKYNRKIKHLTLDEFRADQSWFAQQVAVQAAQLKARTEAKPVRVEDITPGGDGGN